MLPVVPIVILGNGVPKVALLNAVQFVTWPIENYIMAMLSSCVKV